MIKLFLALLLLSCNRDATNYVQKDILIDAHNQFKTSTSAGNLITTALRQKHDLDIVLYPTTLIREGLGVYQKDLADKDIAQIISLYPDGEKDQFVIGTMSGSNIKTFIKQRSLERFALELEVSGLRYDLMYKGGMLVSEAFSRDRQRALIDDEFYSVAISQYFIFSNETFPSYKYRNSIERIFVDSTLKVSARQALRELLAKKQNLPLLLEARARVRATSKVSHGVKSIAEIQGNSHLSPLFGDRVSTQGVITTWAQDDTYPGGYTYYIQSTTPDSDSRTSEAIKLYSPTDLKLKVGDLIEVAATVYEETNHIQNGLTATALREVEEIKIIKTNQTLPAAIDLNQLKIPEEHFSSYNGNINLKPSLDLSDGLDFWEALEGMRVTLPNPKIVGFRGGKEQSDDHKSHLTLYLLPNGNRARRLDTPSSGILADPDKDLFNPQIIPLISGPMTRGLQINANYKMGDLIAGNLTGHVSFAKNLFGDGEYVFTLPNQQPALDSYYQSIENRILTQMQRRPKISFKSSDLSIAAYNVKNLSPVNKKRISETGEMIANNLNCPDVLGLVEIQDNNGEIFQGSSNADDTLELLIKATPCNYQEANIDPLVHREGGVPGANIRVSLLFNPKKLKFVENQLPGPEVETIIQADGSLNYNPGRVYPQDRAFRNSRKSLVVEFEYKGRPLVVIVNHFNSKLSDTSHFSSIWPMVYPSETKRSGMAKAINRFVARIEKRNPESLIAVVGDFNEFTNMRPMRILEGNTLFNLMRKIPKNMRYTTNHNGNSQPLDYIFVNENLKKANKDFKALHLNSDYMGRLSDHDPIIGLFGI